MKKPQVKTLQSALRLLIILFYFFTFSEFLFIDILKKPSTPAARNISKISWKQAGSYKKQSLFCVSPIGGWLIFLLMNMVEIPGATDEMRAPGTPTRRTGGAGRALMLMFSHVLPPAHRSVPASSAPLRSAPLRSSQQNPSMERPSAKLRGGFVAYGQMRFCFETTKLFHLWLELDLNPGCPKERRNVLTPSAPAIFNVDGRISPSTCKYHTSAASNSVLQTICLCEHLCKTVIKAKGMKCRFNFRFASPMVSFLTLNPVSFQVIFWEIVTRWNVKFLPSICRNKASSYALTPSALSLVNKYLSQQAKFHFPPYSVFSFLLQQNECKKVTRLK